MLGRATDKFGEELEVTNILNKLRNSYDIIKTLKDKQNSILMKFSKERVIEVDDTEESEEEVEEAVENVDQPGKSIDNLIQFSDESSFDENDEEEIQANQEDKI